MDQGYLLVPPVVELEKAKDGEISEEDKEGVQHDHTTLNHQGIV